MEMESKKRKVSHYADREIFEYDDTKVPKFLKWVYVIVPIWGIFWFYQYWNGSHGVLDRGHWQGLEKAAKTTVPFERPDKVSEKVDYLPTEEEK